ncbi:unnamed protein product [Dibothriocephalus latus]|uniref:Uncharacterized protein n=1 Tax=Dibothriocephalus latus TaxID=60516 RepID=A0A3P7P033_DIBLA|nr:unnamed protein product [Dibothriocephalus latus]
MLVFIVMGCFGGLLGALFVKLNCMLTQYRQLNVKSKTAKVCEAAVIAALTAACSVTLVLLVADCRPIAPSTTHFPLQLVLAVAIVLSKLPMVGSEARETSDHGLIACHKPLADFSDILLMDLVPGFATESAK